MSENLNSTMNGTQPSTCYWNPTAEKIGMIFAYCLAFLVSLAGNTVIGIIAYKTKTMRKPINFLIVNMAMSDLLFPSFLVPWDIQQLYINSWLIGGPLGQVLCKLTYYLPEVSLAVSVQSLVLIAVDRFGAVVYPLRSPLISSKLCPFFILATWIVALATKTPDLFSSKLVEDAGGLECTLHWKEVFGESSSYENYVVSCNVLKMAIAIVLGFAVCMVPSAILWLLQFFVSNIWSCGFLYFSVVAVLMSRVNGAMNPCICFIFNRNYRIGLKTVFR
ncbi:substance-K receptor-like [Orbicella faveolata]|uniref:substance-K receptor-like n=1 Tax=Orbicella faveolata TaxID=48498 RepID=UPI0009E4488A|nr:substance-K receptor-like [Orbicella faveolata]